MSDKRPTSQHLVQAANFGIRGTSQELNQLSTSGKRAQEKRDKAPEEDKTPAESLNQGKGGSQQSGKEKKK
ncbi:MAG: hypothetical protein Q9217_004223 [Psora testacea]